MIDPMALISPESETAVISAMLMHPEEAIDPVAERLKSGDFKDPKNQIVFRALLAMREKSVAIDMTTLLAWLTDRKQIVEVGGMGFLAELVANFASVHNLEGYIGTVADKAMRRRLYESLRQSSNLIFEIADPELLKIEVERSIGEAMSSHETSETKTAALVAKTLYERVTSAYAVKGGIPGISTGFAKLDAITNGWQSPRLVLVAGRPGDGKSVLAENFAFTAAKQGHPVGIFTLEMDAEEYGTRTMAHEAEVSGVRQGRGDMDEPEMARLCNSLKQYSEMPIYYEDFPALNIIGMRAKARKMVKKYGVKLFILDYLTLLDSTEAGPDELARARHCMRMLKKLSKELQRPIIVLAQINRKGAEVMKNEEPENHHIRNAGEDDADTVILLHRLPNPTPMQIEKCYFPTKLKVSKNRGGQTGFMTAILEGPYNRFTEEGQSTSSLPCYYNELERDEP